MAPKLPGFLASQLAGANVPPGSSRDFCALIKAIGESGTNHEERRIIAREAKFLQEKMKQPSVSKKQMKEFLVRLMYCEMLGHEVEFGYIHAVKFTQHASLLEKRVGYLAVSTLLHEDHELIMLLINTIQRDLKSTNVVEICMALTTICKLINAEMIPAVIHLVEEKLRHSREIVRKKAVLALHRFYTRSPSSISHLIPNIRKALCDTDIGVMAATLNIFYDMSLANNMQFKDLVPSFVSVLKQIVEHRLPRDFDYHKVPAPWLQIKLLKILALLGKDDQSASEQMYEVLRDTLKHADVQSSAAYAVVYECTMTATAIYPSSQLVELAARSVGRFLRTENNNLKYLGITALAAIVGVDPKYANPHKALVIDCLDDPDETLKRKTLDLLCKMTNPANVKVIVERLLGYLKASVDVYLRKDLTPRIVELAERYAPDNLWYFETMNELFRASGDLMDESIAHNLMRLLAEGTEDEDEDAELRLVVAESYIDLLEEPNLPDILVQTMAWVVGEYSYVTDEYDQQVILQLMCELLDRTYVDNATTKGWILTSISKLISRTGMFPPAVREKVTLWLSSMSSDLQQRSRELLALASQPALMQQVLPLDASCEDLEVDSNLSFLDGIVQSALASGARAYIPAEQRAPKPQALVEPETTHIESTFRFEAYDAPAEPKPLIAAAPPSSAAGSATQTATQSGQSSPKLGRVTKPEEPSSSLVVGTKRWSRGGDLKKKQQQTEQVAQEPQPDNALVDTGAGAADGTTLIPTDASSSSTKAAPSPKSSPVPSRKQPATTTTRSLDPDKQALADELFGGSSSATATTPPATRRSRARKSRAAKSSARRGEPATSTSAGNGEVDLLGGLDMTTGSVSTPTASTASGDLLGDLMSLDSPATSLSTSSMPPSYDDALTAPTLPSASTTGVDDLDLLGGLGSSMPATPATPQTSGDLMADDLLGLSTGSSLPGASSSGNSAGLEDMMGSLLLPSAASTSTAQQGAASDTDAFGLMLGMGAGSTSSPAPTVELPADLKQFPHSPVTALAEDAAFVVRCITVWRDDCLDTVLFIENKSAKTVSGAVLSVDSPRGMLRTDAGASQPKTTLTLSSHALHTQIISWKCSSVSAAMSSQCSVAYKDGATNRHLRFKLALVASDVLRPWQISTEQFGGMWGAPCSERQQRLTNTKCSSIEQVTQITSSVRLHTVQIIGPEVILAASVLGDTAQSCLVHCKLEYPVLTVTVHTQNMAFTEAVMRQLAAAL
eukprot:m.355581 g.355581  ORF g.355581 m.355581 type:complete len:1244 (+) comp17286_c0_seq1:170-3901(+)